MGTRLSDRRMFSEGYYDWIKVAVRMLISILLCEDFIWMNFASVCNSCCWALVLVGQARRSVMALHSDGSTDQLFDHLTGMWL